MEGGELETLDKFVLVRDQCVLQTANLSASRISFESLVTN